MTDSPFVPVTPITAPVAITPPSSSSASDFVIAMPSGKNGEGKVQNRDELYGVALAETMSHVMAVNKQITESAIGNMNLQCLQAVLAHLMDQQNSTPAQLLAMLEALKNSLGSGDPAMASFLEAQIAFLKTHVGYEDQLHKDVQQKEREAAKLKKEENDPANKKDPAKEKELRKERAKVEAEIAHDKGAIDADKSATMTQAEGSIQEFIAGAKVDSDADLKMLDQATKSDSSLVSVFKAVGYFGFSSKSHDTIKALASSQEEQNLKAKEKSQDMHKELNTSHSQPESAKGISTHFSFTQVFHHG